MNFSAPWCLWVLPTLAIPVLIHLFSLRRAVRVYFSDNRFLEQVEKKTGHRRQLKQRLTLAARLLFLAALICAFAQPYLPAPEAIGRTQKVAFYIDNSWSMTAPTPKNERALDVGIQFAQRVIQSLPAATQYKVATNDLAPSAAPFESAEKAMDHLAQIEPTAALRSAEATLRRMATENAEADLFWISDFQRSWFSPPPTHSMPAFRPVVIPLQPMANAYVDSIYLENPFAIGGEDNSVKARIGVGGGPTNSVGVKLLINGAQYGAAIAQTAGGFATVSFDLAAQLTGLHAAQLELDDSPIRFDNTFYLTLNFSERINVLEIRGNRQSRHIADVFGNAALFQYASAPARQADYDAAAAADLIVLNEVDAIDASLQSALESLLRQGGKTLLLIPGAAPHVNSYEQLTGIQGMRWNDHPERFALDRPDLQDPFFRGIFQSMPAALQMASASAALDWDGNRSALLTLRNGQPFISRRGNIFLFSCPLQSRYTDFDRNALFVPIMYKIAATRQGARAAYYTVGEGGATVAASAIEEGASVRLAGAQELTPAQRRAEDKLWLNIPAAIAPGNYRALQGARVVDMLSFNIDKRESDLRQYSAREIDSLYRGIARSAAVDASHSQSFASLIASRYVETPLWRWALILALLGLLVETILIRYVK